MDEKLLSRISLSTAVSNALREGRAVVALESTVIAHGLPRPHNLELARDCEDIVRKAGSLPATIGIAGGVPVIGLDSNQLEEMASRQDVAKVNLSNLAHIVAGKKWGATTVAASLLLAWRSGLNVFATGGIGGVHRGVTSSLDISADLTALSRYPVVTVCSGAKAILDLPRTMEMLETMGVPVVGYQTDELPAFYSRQSGIHLDITADSAAEVAAIAKAHWETGGTGSILVAAPIPVGDAIPADEISTVIDEALAEAASDQISGKAVTPFLLTRIAEKTSGRALRSNLALLKNNARIASEISVALAASR